MYLNDEKTLGHCSFKYIWNSCTFPMTSFKHEKKNGVLYFRPCNYDYFMNNFMNSGLNLNAKASILMKFHA